MTVMFPYSHRVDGTHVKEGVRILEAFEMWIWRRMEGIKLARQNDK